MVHAGSRISRSDKYYWHRYTEVYEPLFARLPDPKLIVELGIFRGDSMAWLAEQFPRADLVGVDILAAQPDWPASRRIRYVQADQGDRLAIAEMFANLPGPPGLILEDGSHIPRHQVNCLVEGFARLRPGGLYVLEDICTSHPMTDAFSHYSRSDGEQLPNALHVLLALQHLRDTNATLTPCLAARLSSERFFAASEIRTLFGSIAEIQLHKRTKLPLRCYGCGGSTFDYVRWRCECGVDLYHPTNSMTCLIWKAGGPASIGGPVFRRLREWRRLPAWPRLREWITPGPGRTADQTNPAIEPLRRWHQSGNETSTQNR
jgi:predicted O-methyltransferase YrrM